MRFHVLVAAEWFLFDSFPPNFSGQNVVVVSFFSFFYLTFPPIFFPIDEGNSSRKKYKLKSLSIICSPCRLSCAAINSKQTTHMADICNVCVSESIKNPKRETYFDLWHINHRPTLAFDVIVPQRKKNYNLTERWLFIHEKNQRYLHKSAVSSTKSIHVNRHRIQHNVNTNASQSFYLN